MIIVGCNYFTDEQVEELRKNKYVKNASNKAITYTEEFKEIFLCEYNDGNPPSVILTKMGFDCKTLGQKRINNISYSIKQQSIRAEGFKDTRKGGSGRPSIKNLTQEEIIKRQQDQIEYLKQQVEFLSDLRRLEREAMWKASKSNKKKNSK